MRPPAIQAERERAAAGRVGRRTASMRPPAIQAERPEGGAGRRAAAGRFNEAACNTGGTPAHEFRRLAYHPLRFNEAACNTGGTRAR